MQYVHVCESTCVPVYMHAYVYGQNVHLWVCTHMNMSVLMYEHSCIIICMCVCMHVCVHVCMCNFINSKLQMGNKLYVVPHARGCQFEAVDWKLKSTLLTLSTLSPDKIKQTFLSGSSTECWSDHWVI